MPFTLIPPESSPFIIKGALRGPTNSFSIVPYHPFSLSRKENHVHIHLPITINTQLYLPHFPISPSSLPTFHRHNLLLLQF
ncbi:hypothetical protein RJT34_19276 [Clitoria ternatea]|uniref:Uncharacterized protein n=1 Tax=Clitoria ternatea TaxID=43366 RepID=A0AAN9IR67_CLITE